MHPRLLVPFALLGGVVSAQSGHSIPSVIVTVENAQPSRGVFLTPPWLGVHDGTFDLLEMGRPASFPLGGNEIESLAEDGNTGPLGMAFAALAPGAPQVAGLAGPGGPLAPGDRASRTINVDPRFDRFFSYGSMVIPSNDSFLANGNPRAHVLFDDDGRFVGKGFVVSGDESKDAGTEANDELAPNVAFLGQAAPNTGQTEGGVVRSPGAEFAAPGALDFPNGVLNHAVFGNADFNDRDDRLLKVSFRYVDLGATNRFLGPLGPDQEIQGGPIDSMGVGFARVYSTGQHGVRVVVRYRDLSGPIQGAHLHLAAEGSNGPVVVDLGPGLFSEGHIRLHVEDSDLTGPLAGLGHLDLLNELAAGNVYVNLHTAAYPGGEIRGQLSLRE